MTMLQISCSFVIDEYILNMADICSCDGFDTCARANVR